MISEPPPGVTVDAESVSENLSEWKINIDGVEGTLYDGEHFQLLFKFNNKYPFDSPEVSVCVSFNDALLFVCYLYNQLFFDI